jgi:phosphatidylglycerophosphate synthase
MVDMLIMSLHRAIRSDWSDIPPQQRNIWQRWAAASRGVIAPANLVSIAGAVLVLYGLYLLSTEHILRGATYIFVGRMADIFDGYVAEHTKTKSPFGEALDASVDKILIILALVIVFDKHLVPLIVGIGIAIQTVYVTGLAIVARRLSGGLHPSRSGKISTALIWLSTGLFLIVDVLKQRGDSLTFARGAAYSCFGLFLITALWSSVNYTRYVYYKRKMRP